ncbi:hypothetical protein NQZ68_014797 [Dissostichus eleginoides]|nr:hypothetical protein NQZ68_014797 [Dissostichus eleginoides]
MTWCPLFFPHGRSVHLRPTLDMEDYDVRSAASIMASVKEQEARFEQLTRALEEERRNVTLQLDRSTLPPNTPTSQPLAWQQVVMQVNDANTPVMLNHQPAPPSLANVTGTFVSWPVLLSMLADSLQEQEM